MCDLGQNWIELISVTMLLLTGFHAFLLLKSFSFYWNIYYLSLHACMLSRFNHAWLFMTLWTVARQAALPMGFSRQEYWSGLLCPPPRDLPNPGTALRSLTSLALAGRFFTTSATCTPLQCHISGLCPLLSFVLLWLPSFPWPSHAVQWL